MDTHQLRGHTAVPITMQQWLLSGVVVGYIWLCGCVPAMQSLRRCVFLSKRDLEVKKEVGDVRMEPGNVSVQHCAQTSCCVGYYHLVEGQPPVADSLSCDLIYDRDCPNVTCHATKEFKSFIPCLCGSDLCNGNITWNLEPQTESPQLNHPVSMDMMSFVLIVPVGIFLCLMVLALKRRNFFKGHDNEQQSFSEGSLASDQPDVDLTSLELQQVVGRGHFAQVWRGVYRGSAVAVKVFPAGCKHRFTTEREVYELPLMEHAGITPFLGAGRLEGGEAVLLLKLAMCGSLHSFLAKSSSDWASSLLMCQSLCEGLAFLHSDHHRHGVHKPPVAHRDLSSNNVLVRADGSCALCDFGCSTILQTWQHSSRTIQDSCWVGTLRYMAPEILEGSVNLSRGCSCLLQGDMYGLALLLWEIWNRCSDLHTGRPVPEHLLPYEAELGPCPSLEAVLLHVAERRQRPPVPSHWEQALHGVTLQEILADCWDHDADARLTSLCAMNRLLALPFSVHMSCVVAPFDA